VSGAPYRTTFTIGVEDVVDYLRIVQRRLNQVSAVAGAVLCLVGVTLIVTGVDPLTGVVALVAGLLTVGAAQTRYFDRWRVRRGARRIVGTRASFEIGDEGLLAETATITGRVPWSSVTALRANERILVFMRDRLPVAWIPTRAFASEADLSATTQFIREHITGAGAAPRPTSTKPQ
jgi:hypothetical protein